MRIGIVNRANIADVRSSSGYPYFMAKALQKHVGEVTYLGPDTSSLARAVELGGKALSRLSYSAFGRRLTPSHNRLLSWSLAKSFGSRLTSSGCDVLFAPNASVEIACLSTPIPIVYSTDLTWANFADYYPSSASLWTFSKAEGERIEAAAIGKAGALIYPSPWVSETAIGHYKADPGKVHCIPFGANFAEEDIPSRELAFNHPIDRGISLLWVGVDWVRKGGSIAYDCLMELLRCGIDAKMTVCGCVPPDRFSHRRITVIPFLGKNDPAQIKQLSKLFLDSNFLIFPTVAEAFGIVLCEASAHGLPSLVRDTGGVGGAITDGQNGFLMFSDATGKHYAEKVMDVVGDMSGYNDLVKGSRSAYEGRLNWDSWGRSVKPIFEGLVSKVTVRGAA